MRQCIFPLFLLLIVPISGCGGGTAGTGGFDFTGEVLEGNGTPIAGIAVGIEDANGDDLGLTETGEDGSFEFTNIGSEDAVLQIQKGSAQQSEIAVSIPKGLSRAVITAQKESNGRFSAKISYVAKAASESRGAKSAAGGSPQIDPGHPAQIPNTSPSASVTPTPVPAVSPTPAAAQAVPTSVPAQNSTGPNTVPPAAAPPILPAESSADNPKPGNGNGKGNTGKADSSADSSADLSSTDHSDDPELNDPVLNDPDLNNSDAPDHPKKPPKEPKPDKPGKAKK